jgi:AhpD family alkylhydroperoxidase
MSRIPVPDGQGPEVNRIWMIDPKLGEPALALREAVYQDNHLPIRVHEAVRYLIAQANQCPICLAARSAAGRENGMTEEFYDAVENFRDSDLFDERERLALEYTYRFCHDHTSIDDDMFADLRRVFGDVELVDLCITVSRHFGFGRLTMVLGLDLACAVDAAAMSSDYWVGSGQHQHPAAAR